MLGCREPSGGAEEKEKMNEQEAFREKQDVTERNGAKEEELMRHKPEYHKDFRTNSNS